MPWRNTLAAVSGFNHCSDFPEVLGAQVGDNALADELSSFRHKYICLIAQLAMKRWDLPALWGHGPHVVVHAVYNLSQWAFMEMPPPR